ncbi:hypothetical protein [Nocardia sp. CDC160]|uniref:hypothetical protein n=1 Tax=Nocardia sp. CDC160 TaxID=3112166 RepID=UPI002DBF19F6|nr:hypothetical protein [Nocardia sp. CDC160]MEC3917676.1 hypothetical protein [Nocardia sp. CDC160]
MKRSLTLTAASVISIVAGVLWTAPAQAGAVDGSLQNLSAISNSELLGAVINSSMTDNASNDENVRVTGTVTGLGIDVGEGSEQITLHPGAQQVADPITTNVGTVSNGENVVVTVNVVDVNTGVSLLALTKTMTCHLDSSGNGSCS